MRNTDFNQSFLDEVFVDNAHGRIGVCEHGCGEDPSLGAGFDRTSSSYETKRDSIQTGTASLAFIVFPMCW